MPIHAQLIQGGILLRCGRNFRHYGDEYEFVCSVTIEPPATAYIQGASGTVYPGMRQEIKAKLREMGFRRLRWERRKWNRNKDVETST